MRARYGFSLLEMSIVLLIMALVIGGGAAMLTGSMQKKQYDETVTKQRAIQKALLDYRRAFNRLPCPADLTLAMSNANFAVEGATAGTCTGGTPAANFTAGSTVAGMVPTHALQLPDDYAFDGWGRRMFYAVSTSLTATNAFTTVAVSDVTTRLTVNSAAGTARTTIAAYVVLSMGSNGHGTYPRDGGATRIFTGSTNTDELENCDCTASAAGTYDVTFVQKMPTENSADPLDNFDDVVVYAGRADLRSGTE